MSMQWWMRKRVGNAALLSFLTILISAAIGVAAQDNSDQSAALKSVYRQRLTEFGPCERTSVTPLAQVVAQSRCLVYEVAENPDDPQGRRIPLKIMVIPAFTADPKPDPLVILAGGPGQAATDLVMLAGVFNRARQEREILLVDQRGTGSMSPLQCDIEEDESIIYSLDEVLAFQRKNLPECLRQMEAAPQYYTTDIAMADLEAIRQYLGYSRYNLWGGSYGTRAALTFLQMFPDSVRSVIVDGVAPPAMALPTFIERDASAALEKVFDDCAAQPNCASAYPNLREHYDELIATLAAPRRTALFDGAENSKQEITVNRAMLMAAIRFTLYGRETQRLTPYVIEQAHAGNFQPLAAISAPATGINQYMMSSVLCSEDYALIQSGHISDNNKQNYRIVSPLFTQTMLEACELWPRRALPPEYFEPVVSDKPVLIFSGALDPVTPPSWGEQVAQTLTNSRHIVVDGFAHNTMGSPCTMAMLNDFVGTADVNAVDVDCLGDIKRRPFFVNANGSALTKAFVQEGAARRD